TGFWGAAKPYGIQIGSCMIREFKNPTGFVLAFKPVEICSYILSIVSDLNRYGLDLKKNAALQESRWRRV
ncbi:MAG: hypothetical protein KJ645_06605, partial [Planctomycetes bacterium]|nr:hypothetical protein [Planctomycetota bacterium]